MFTITKRFDFCASHQLQGLPPDHQCGRPHGHNYTVHVTLMDNDLDEVGFIRDYGQLDSIKQYLDKYVEHRCLNDVYEFNPTAENLAKYFYTIFKGMFKQVFMVKVKETDKTEATYADMPDIMKIIEELNAALLDMKEVLHSKI